MALSGTDMDELVARLQASVGTAGAPMVKEIEKGALLKFCLAIGETDPIYTDADHARAAGYSGLVATPTYLSIFSEACGAVLRGDVPFTQFLHTDDAITSHLPICAGDLITATPTLAAVFGKRNSRGALLFQTVDIALTNQRRELAASLRVTTAHHE